MKTIIYTVLALIAFAANSVLGRLALDSGAIDANSFTIIRLISGALALSLLARLTASKRPTAKSAPQTFWAPLMLFLYASTFSLAYLQLEAGIGALVLFGSVQITMVLVGMYLGDRLSLQQIVGLILACLGLTYLMWPTSDAIKDPGQVQVSLTGFLLMSISGIAWGAYTLLGKHASDPLQNTASNFVRSVPYTLILVGLFALIPLHISFKGIMLALVAGALTSGIGYAIWYQALRQLNRMHASVLQLSVPFLATLGGVVFLDEIFTLKLSLSLVLLSVGIFFVIYVRPKEKFI